MTCRPIQGLKFDEKTRDALLDLAKRRRIAKILNYLLPSAVTINALMTDRVFVASYNITSTDYESVATAMQTLPRIYRNRVETISHYMIFTHYSNPVTPQERKLQIFWENMSYHCKMEILPQ